MRYSLLQLPELALLVLILIFVQRWTELPVWILWGSITLWVLKDAMLYPLVWRAYDWDRSREDNPMVGSRGITKERLAPSGYVRVRGELWMAEVTEGNPPIEEGERVRVREVRGLTLLVQPEGKQGER